MTRPSRDLFETLSHTADLCIAEREKAEKLATAAKLHKQMLEDHLVLFANILNAMRGKGGIRENNIKIALRKEIDRTKAAITRTAA